MDIQEINQSSPEFLYQMLGRLEADSVLSGERWALCGPSLGGQRAQADQTDADDLPPLV